MSAVVLVPGSGCAETAIETGHPGEYQQDNACDEQGHTGLEIIEGFIHAGHTGPQLRRAVIRIRIQRLAYTCAVPWELLDNFEQVGALQQAYACKGVPVQARVCFYNPT